MKAETTISQGWDEIVFENRNKAYGAYFIRKIYSKNVVIASIAALLIIIFVFVFGLIFLESGSFASLIAGIVPVNRMTFVRVLVVVVGHGTLLRTSDNRRSERTFLAGWPRRDDYRGKLFWR